MSEPQASQNVSVEQNGRVLTGGPGTSLEALEQAVERSAPEPTAEAEPKATQSTDEQPKATRGRERFSELTHQREEANKRAHEANERAIALADRLEALEKRTAQTGPPVAGPDDDAARVVVNRSQQETAPSASRPEPSEDEVGTTYAKYGDYVKDLTLWQWEQREAQAAATRTQTARAERWTQTRQTATQQYPDFDQMIASGPGADIDIGAQRMQYLLDTDGGEHVIYRLAKDADAARRVAGMSDFDFGILFKGLVPSEPAAQPVQRASKAPAPYQPVNGGGRTAATSSAEAAAKGNFDEYRLKRAAERGVKPKYR